MRKTIIFVSPALIILTSLAINLPNTDLHKSTLKKNDFYLELSTELDALSGQIKDQKAIRPNSLQESVIQGFFGFILPEIGTEQWLQENIESNLDNFKAWLNDPSQEEFKFVDTTDQFNEISNKYNDQITDFISKTSDQRRICSPQEIESFESRELNCYLENPIDNNTYYSNFQKINNLNILEPLNWVKSSYRFSRLFILPIIIIYFAVIVFIIISTKIIDGETKKTTEMILGRIGYPTTIISLAFIGILNIGLYTSLFASNIFGKLINTIDIVKVIQSQLSLHIWVIFAPALYVGLIFIALNLTLKTLPKF